MPALPAAVKDQQQGQRGYVLHVSSLQFPDSRFQDRSSARPHPPVTRSHASGSVDVTRPVQGPLQHPRQEKPVSSEVGQPCRRRCAIEKGTAGSAGAGDMEKRQLRASCHAKLDRESRTHAYLDSRSGTDVRLTWFQITYLSTGTLNSMADS